MTYDLETAATVTDRLNRAIARAQARGDAACVERVRAKLPHAARIAAETNREMAQAQAEFDRRGAIYDV